MTDHELLLAISGIMDKKLIPIENRLDAMQDEIHIMQGEIRNMQGMPLHITMAVQFQRFTKWFPHTSSIVMEEPFGKASFNVINLECSSFLPYSL